MNNKQAKELCINLMKADNEDEILRILKDCGYWDDPDVWRFYGDYESNFNTIGNQQSRPEAALVEKIVNSVDARLMNECLVSGIDPEGEDAPSSIREAVAKFFDPEAMNGASAGLMREWTATSRTKVARGITLAATGFSPKEGYPCFSIVDNGEGQTPDDMPVTFFSLTRSNKLRIPFVQGKFNMGGTGVFQFSGKHNLQLVISRRNPKLIDKSKANSTDHMWGFSIVRREKPTGGRRNSVYTYLAPLNNKDNPNKGGVLRFQSQSLEIFPDRKNPYARAAEWGTLIKLYEYEVTGRTNILRRGGLLSKLDLMLPFLALPVRLHECRTSYRGKKGSFDTTLTGVGVRLDDDKKVNLEFDPTSSPISIRGEHMTATVYAFKKGVAQTYKGNEGVIFILNGQTHAHLTSNFFRHPKVGMSYIADSILVTVDCSDVSRGMIEDLFMNSRDRLRDREFKKAIESELQDLFKNHRGLRELKEKRRREEVQSRIADDKPLEDVLKSILRDSPMLANLFIFGSKLSNPFKTKNVGEQDKKFEGKRYPTYFNIKGLNQNDILVKDCHINMKSRLSFETDAIDDYFSRQIDRGEFRLYSYTDDNQSEVEDYLLNLHNGIATLSLRLPPNCEVGDYINFISVVNDGTQIEPFTNRFRMLVKEERDYKSGGNGRRKTVSKKTGSEREIPGGLSLPNIYQVNRGKWESHDPPYNDYTALRIIHFGSENDNGDEQQIYDFYVNIDNIYLNTELKRSKKDIETVKAQFVNGLVILGLAILKDYHEALKKPGNNNFLGQDVEELDIRIFVDDYSRAAASVILPIIDSLSGLEIEED